MVFVLSLFWLKAACVHLRNGVLEQNGYKIYCFLTIGWRNGKRPNVLEHGFPEGLPYF